MISHFQNRHMGQTGVIIGTGPSLRSVPIAFLSEYPTFGQNKCWLPPLHEFTPTYYVTSDPDNDIDRAKVDALNCEKFTRRGTGFKNAHEFDLTRNKIFSMRPDVCVHEGYSVTFISLQLAYFMGFSTVLLVGVDHRYTPYKIGMEKDPNHYSDEYDGKTNFDPRSLEKGEREIPASMELARRAYEASGRRVINLSEGSALKVFERGKVEDFIVVDNDIYRNHEL